MVIRMCQIGGLKGQQAHSLVQRPGYRELVIFALKGQKHCFPDSAFAPPGRYRVIAEDHL